MTKNELLAKLQSDVLSDGTTQFRYSSDPIIKSVELELLSELETEGCIQQLTVALGYVLYKLL